jgi:hypothetical protein
MAADTTQTPDSLAVDMDNLYREESFTDLRAANIKRLTPITRSGEPDGSRPAQYSGDTTLMTQMGPIPVQFPLDADSLGEAFEKFPQGVQDAIERLQERAKEMAREETSRIVVPGAPGAGPLPGTGPGGKLILD